MAGIFFKVIWNPCKECGKLKIPPCNGWDSIPGSVVTGGDANTIGLSLTTLKRWYMMIKKMLYSNSSRLLTGLRVVKNRTYLWVNPNLTQTQPVTTRAWMVESRLISTQCLYVPSLLVDMKNITDLGFQVVLMSN